MKTNSRFQLVLIAFWVLFSAGIFGQPSTFIAVPGHAIAEPAGLLPAKLTIWVEIKQEVPLIALFPASDGMLGRFEFIENYPFIYAVYNDGTAIFSRDITVGGPPYYSSTLNESDMQSLRTALRQTQVTPNINVPYYGEEGFGHTAVIVQDGKLTKMSSCHIYYESSGDYLATSEGLIAADGQCFSDIAASEPSHFVQYRNRWDHVFDLHAFVDRAGSELLGNLQCDTAFASSDAVFELTDKFWRSRELLARFAADGDTMRIDEIRQKYADISPVYPPPNCE